MTTITSYPGVYVSENLASNISVIRSGPTIPAFVFERHIGHEAPPDNIVCYHTWAEFNATQSQPHANLDYYLSVYGWFMSGGGKCYLVHLNFIALVNQYDDISLLVSAGTAFYIDAVFNGLVELINSGQRIFGLLDTNKDKIEANSNAESVMKPFPVTQHAAAFYPRCYFNEMLIPASVVAAIAIAKTDSSRGVWKAPANVVINGIMPQYPVSDDLQGRFTQGKALNMIRTFPELGTVLWGARTLEDSDNWRYISVRRLFNMVERDIQKSLNKMVFEPNSQPTWHKVKAAVVNYLYSLWQQGALLGNKAEEAYFVDIGKDITMTDDDIKQGIMNIKVGLAAVRPAEFILLQFSQTISQ